MHLAGKSRTVLIQTVAVLLSACAALGQTAPSQPGTPSARQSTPADWFISLGDNSLPQDTRDAAARKLVAVANTLDPKQRDAIRDQLVLILQQDRSGGDIAVAQALADSGRPDADFVKPLETDLIDRSQGQSPAKILAVTAAATALAQFDSTPQQVEVLTVLTRLVADPDNPPDDVQIPAIRAIGFFTQTAAVDNLVYLITNRDHQDIVSAAADALEDMTGLALGHNPAPWQKWWETAKKNFPASIQASREQGYLQGRRNTYQDANRQDRDLRQTYTNTPPGERPALLLRFLQSSDPVMRQVGADKVFEAISINPPSAEAMQEVRDMLTDPVANVRAAAAHALTQDSSATSLLMDQLKRESDDNVRIELIKALSAHEYQPTVLFFLSLLHPNTSTPVQIAVANAIGESSELIGRTPELRRAVESALQNAYKDKANAEPIKQGLRDAIIRASGDLKDDGLLALLLTAANEEKVQKNQADAIRGIGLLGHKDQAININRFFNNRSAVIRGAAAEAFGNMYDSDYINILADKSMHDLDEVKRAAWDTLQRWLPLMDVEYLSRLSADLNDPSALDHHIIVQTQLVEKLQKVGPSDDLASAQDSLGALLLENQKPGRAAEYFQDAFNYYRDHKKTETNTLDRLASSTVDAMLAAGSWADAAKFVSGVKSAFLGQQAMIGTISTISESLRRKDNELAGNVNPNDFSPNAEKALFDAIGKMDPPLESSIYDDVKRYHEAAQGRAATAHPAGN